MSYQEKKHAALFTAQLLFLASYVIAALWRWRAGLLGPDELRPWAGFMLIAAAVGVALMIGVLVILHFGLAFATAARMRGSSGQNISEKLEEMQTEDEMDELIELKAGRITAAVMSAGGLCALVSLLLGAPNALMLNIFFLSGILGMTAESAASFFYYRKGVRHGKRS